MRRRRKAGLLARQIEAHHRQALVLELDRGARQFERRRGVDLVLGGVLHEPQDVGEIGRHALLEAPHGAEDEPEVEGDVFAGLHGSRGVVSLGALGHALRHGAHDLAHPGRGGHVQLGGEAHLDVAHALGGVVLDQLLGDAREVLGVLQHGAGVHEAVQILQQILVGLLEDELAQARLGIGGELALALAGKLDEGLQAQRAVQVEMEVGLGDGADEFAGDVPSG